MELLSTVQGNGDHASAEDVHAHYADCAARRFLVLPPEQVRSHWPAACELRSYAGVIVSKQQWLDNAVEMVPLLCRDEQVLESDWIYDHDFQSVSATDRTAAVLLSYASWLTVALALGRTLVIAPSWDSSRQE